MTEPTNDATTDEETDSTEEEQEPKFKYIRISNDLQKILNKDSVSCIAVHSRFLCLGTHWGAVNLLDHQGNMVDTAINQPLNSDTPHMHMVSVNQISVDRKGEYVASCSDEGVICINGLYTDENNQRLNVGRPIKSIALEPFHNRSGAGRKFIVGDNKLTLYERSTFLKNLKTTVLSEAEGYVSAIAWNEQFVAWSSSLGVRVYDLTEKCSLGLIKFEEPTNGMLLSEFRCNLKWSNGTTLLIGWVEMVQVCVMRKRNSVEISTRDLPGFIVDPISVFKMDFYVCGLAPLESSQLVILGYPKECDSDTGKSLRPILRVVEYKSCDYNEICSDDLSLRGFQEYKWNDYHLDCLIEENQYFIVSPKDIVVASLYENDDRIKWFIEHGKFQQAMDVISVYGGRYSLVSVARLYLDHLLSLGEYDNAAELCLRTFGNDKLLWEEEVYKFVKVQQLRSVSAYLPRTNDCKLNPHVYEMVLYEYLQLDPTGFLALIKEWQPTLYNTSAVINAIHDHFCDRDRDILIESLAILYSHERKYEKALAMYLKLQHKDVFNLIRTHDLYTVIHRMIIPLIQLDCEKAFVMLLETDKIPSDIVVENLEQRQEFLFKYLEALDKVDKAKKYHSKMVNLYAKYSADKLLSFLKRSNNYPIREALDVCQRELFYPEMVYLLGRMGNTGEALSIIMNKLNDIQMAIDFCKENDDMDLWMNLINQSIERPDIITKLLDGIAGFIDPEILVNKIKFGQNIPGLKQSLIKMLSNYSLQVEIQTNCNRILTTDYYNLHEKVTKSQQRAQSITSDSQCGMCLEHIIVRDPKTNILIFNCRHIFHETCLRNDFKPDLCTVCKSPVT